MDKLKKFRNLIKNVNYNLSKKTHQKLRRSLPHGTDGHKDRRTDAMQYLMRPARERRIIIQEVNKPGCEFTGFSLTLTGKPGKHTRDVVSAALADRYRVDANYLHLHHGIRSPAGFDQPRPAGTGLINWRTASM